MEIYTIGQVFQPSIINYIYRNSTGFVIETAYIYMSVAVTNLDCAADLSRGVVSKPIDDTEFEYYLYLYMLTDPGQIPV
jgi:hypothetical protein